MVATRRRLTWLAEPADPAERVARGRILLGVAIALLLMTRLALLFGLEVQQSSDLAWYEARAAELLRSGTYSENGISTAYWPVGYPAFLAGAMLVFGGHPWSGQVANLLLSLATLLLLHRWCMQRWGDATVAGLAAVLLALYPNHMGYTVGLYSEPLFTTLLLGVLVCLSPRAHVAQVLLAGLLTGAAILVKAQMLLLGPLLILVSLLPDRSWAGFVSALRPFALAMLTAALVLAPWVYRNLVVMGEPIIVSTNGGMSLLAANNPAMGTDLRTDYDDNDQLVRAVKFSVSDQVGADRRARTAAWNWIASNPVRFLALMPKKLFRLWAPDGESEWLFQAGYSNYEKHKVWFRAVRIGNQVIYIGLLAMCALALPKVFDRNDPATWTLPLLLAFFSVLCMVFSGQSRYRSPLMPLIIGYAALTCMRWRAFWRQL